MQLANAVSGLGPEETLQAICSFATLAADDLEYAFRPLEAATIISKHLDGISSNGDWAVYAARGLAQAMWVDASRGKFASGKQVKLANVFTAVLNVALAALRNPPTKARGAAVFKVTSLEDLVEESMLMVHSALAFSTTDLWKEAPIKDFLIAVRPRLTKVEIKKRWTTCFCVCATLLAPKESLAMMTTLAEAPGYDQGPSVVAALLVACSRFVNLATHQSIRNQVIIKLIPRALATCAAHERVETYAIALAATVEEFNMMSRASERHSRGKKVDLAPTRDRCSALLAEATQIALGVLDNSAGIAQETRDAHFAFAILCYAWRAATQPELAISFSTIPSVDIADALTELEDDWVSHRDQGRPGDLSCAMDRMVVLAPGNPLLLQLVLDTPEVLATPRWSDRSQVTALPQANAAQVSTYDDYAKWFVIIANSRRGGAEYEKPIGYLLLALLRLMLPLCPAESGPARNFFVMAIDTTFTRLALDTEDGGYHPDAIEDIMWLGQREPDVVLQCLRPGSLMLDAVHRDSVDADDDTDASVGTSLPSKKHRREVDKEALAMTRRQFRALLAKHRKLPSSTQALHLNASAAKDLSTVLRVFMRSKTDQHRFRCVAAGLKLIEKGIATDPHDIARFVSFACNSYSMTWNEARFANHGDQTLEEFVSEEVWAASCDRVNHVRCPGHHALRAYHGVSWQCDGCHNYFYVASMACRQCNYDLCPQCYTDKTGFVSHPRLTIAHDVCSPPTNSALPRRFFASGGTIVSVPNRWPLSRMVASDSPMRTPGSIIVHTVDNPKAKTCACGLVNPNDPIIDAEDAAFMQYSEATSALLATALDRCPLAGIALSQVTTDAGETCIRGLPLALRQLLTALGSSIPLALRRVMLRTETGNSLETAIVNNSAGGGAETPFLQSMEQMELKAKAVSVPRGAPITPDNKLKEMYKAITAALKPAFNFANEAGFGEGPTQEVYNAMVKEQFDTKRLWHVSPEGWVPAFDVKKKSPARDADRIVFVGAAIARAIHDTYLVPTQLHPFVWRAVIDRSQATLENAYKAVDSTAASVLTLRNASAEELEALCLETKDRKEVTPANLARFIKDRIDDSAAAACLEGIRLFAWGFCTVLSPLTLRSYVTAAEMASVCGGTIDAQYFEAGLLRRVFIPTQGYDSSSVQVDWLIEVLSSLQPEDQRAFVEFMTGSPSLPPGGWPGAMTVVKKDFEGSNRGTLPSCSTCFLLLKLPAYDTKAQLERALLLAIREGRQNFALS